MAKRTAGPKIDRGILLLWSQGDQKRFIRAVEKLTAQVNELRVILRHPRMVQMKAEVLAAESAARVAAPGPVDPLSGV